MRFDYIKIKNYRQYRDALITFPKAKHDLQIVIADNGVGKTNLLNACTWCLYGEEPHLGLTGKYAGEPILNKEAIEEAKQAGRFQETVSVEIGFSDGEKRLEAFHSVPVLIPKDSSVVVKVAEARRRVRVYRDSGCDVYEGERASELINRYLPKSIREYFFFDGEQLNNYFKEGHGDRIKEAVYRISQIDAFVRIISRLDQIVKTVRRDASKMDPKTDEYQKRIEEIEETLAGCRKYISERQAEIADLERRVEEIDDRLRDTPDVAELENQKKNLQRQLSELEAERAESLDGYYGFVRNKTIDFNLYSTAIAVYGLIQSMEDEGQLPPQIDKRYLEEMLLVGHCKVCGHLLDDEDRDRVKALLETLRVGTETSMLLTSIKSELSRIIASVDSYPKERERYMKQLEVLDRREGDLSGRLGSVETSLSKYASTSEEIKKLYTDRRLFQEQRDELNQQIGTRRNTIGNREPELNRIKKRLAGALTSNEKATKLQEQVKFGERALKVLKQVESSIVTEVRKEMEHRTEELFRGLVWKDSKCDHISLSDQYQLSLYDRAGYSCAGTCSAAERSLLALSFTLAMHEVSGFESPLFIDTPIARASGENRENFARTLVGISSNKQLILAFTPDEYSESISQEFTPVLASYIKLELDEDERHVLVKEEKHG